MKYDEVKQRIIDSLDHPDTMQVTMVELLEDLKVDYEGIESLKAELDKSSTRIRDLQDTNHKLFLSATSGSSKDDPNNIDEPATGAGVLDEFMQMVTKDEQ